MIDSQARILVGTPLAEAVKARLKHDIAALKVMPKLAIVHISPDESADIYVELKQQFGREIGAAVNILQPAKTELEATIAWLNNDPATHGIIIQLPLPDGIATEPVLASVAGEKDVDGLAPDTPFITAGPRGIMELLEAYGVELQGAKVALAGTGRLFGGPLLRCLERAGAQVEAFNLRRPLDPDVVRQADVVIGATGKPGLVTSEMVAAGTVAIDATGVDIEPAVHERNDVRITPASGGVGPMTVAALFENLYDAVQNQTK